MRFPALCAVISLFTLLATVTKAQDDIEDVIVETYYISDASDATDLTGGGLPAGSVTYRVYLDLRAGSSLRSIYGDANHVLSLISTAPFFNHADRGRTYGHLLNNSALSEGTTPLDSYLTMGRGSSQRLGVLKVLDTDGSEVGGTNNDGGSASVPGGLLVNNTPDMAPALPVADGLLPLAGVPGVPPGFTASGDDATSVLGDATVSGTFVSNDHRIACTSPGVTGATVENQVLVAQFTTTGELSFLLNVEVERPDGSVVKYVATGDTLLPGETLSGLLVYPPDCGCTDPDFLEYDPLAGCDDGSCATAIVFGCLDPTACNYSTTANFNIPELCCYGPTDCNGLDVSLVCPFVGTDELSTSHTVMIYPNPARDLVTVVLPFDWSGPVRHVVLDAAGRVVDRGAWSVASAVGESSISLEGLAPGAYMLQVHSPQGLLTANLVIME